MKFIRCPSFNRQVAGERGVTKHMPDEFINWGDFYIGMLKNSGDWIKSVLETMAASEGTVMYNCATGKDRVGIMSAMLLGIAGVGEDDIIADYCMSMVYLRSVYKYIVTRMITLGEDGEPVFDAPFFRTDPVNMERPLDFIRENFGSVESYVLSLGTDKGAVDEIKRRLAGK
ncbi:MAG: tyrosine-protein phosphatase [Oscillospiraceae bacterium]|nr:tyrosine-protein phosphatase [Oscillospiraceae bacterium]